MTTTTLTQKTLTGRHAPAGGPFGPLITALHATFLRGSKGARRPLSAAEEANQVREMAYTYLATDPGFAADLFAAADRHELAYGKDANGVQA